MKEKNWVALHAKMDILKNGLDTYFEFKRQSRWFFSKEYLRNWWHKWGNPWNRGALPTYKAGFEKQQKSFETSGCQKSSSSENEFTELKISVKM